jgi:hypothetical protein
MRGRAKCHSESVFDQVRRKINSGPALPTDQFKVIGYSKNTHVFVCPILRGRFVHPFQPWFKISVSDQKQLMLRTAAERYV